MKKLLLLFILIPFLSFSQVQIGQDIDGKYGGYQGGNSVSSSSSGDIVAIGSPYRGGVGAASSGHVRIYDNISGVWTQIGDDIVGEADYDESGKNVSLSSNGNIVAIGAPGNDDNGEDSGHVRIYENVSGVWTQIGQDIDGEAAYDESGKSISLSSNGNIVAIGAPGNDGNGDNSGHVRIYENVSGVWTQIGQDIDGEAAGDTDPGNIGRIIDLSLSNDGNIVAIGAPGNDGNGDLSGHVRIYENVSGVWTQIGQDIDGETLSNVIGFSVSISGDGNIVAIGSPFDNGPSGFDSFIGSVRIYENISGVWTQIGQDIYGNETQDWNGFSVSISNIGNIVAIGVPTSSFSNITTGYIHIYENISGIWTQIGQSIYVEGDLNRVSIYVSLSSDGNKVVIGAPNTSVNSGQIKVYENVSNIWTQIGQDINGDTMISEHCGSSVSLSSDGSIVAVGAVGNDDNGTNTGQVRVYENVSNIWTQIGQDINGDEFNTIGSNGSIALSDVGNVLAIGIPSNDDNGTNSGQVRVYENISDVWTQIGQDINGEAAGDNSGGNLSLSNDGNILAIGAIYNDDNGVSSGQVRVYENISGVWTKIGQDIDGEAAGDNSGSSLSLSNDGNILAIGALYNDDNGVSSGHVRVYENISGVWTQIGQDIDGEAAGNNSGSSLSLSSDGSILAIGAPLNDGNGLNSGHVRVYKNISGVWTQIGSDIDSENEGDGSGNSVSLSNNGSIVAIGSRYNDDNGESSGQLRLYQNISEEWTQIGVDINGEVEGDLSGSSISLSGNGNIVAIGAFLNDGNGLDSGHVRVYDLSAELSVESFNNDYFNVFVNATTEKIEIKLHDNQTLKMVNLYTIDGKYLYSEKSLELDTNPLSIGIYIVEVETNKGKSAKKIVIK